MLVVDYAKLAQVAAAHFAVTEFGLKSGGDLHVRAHFKNAIGGGAGRSNFEGPNEAPEMGAGVILGVFGFAAVAEDVIREREGRLVSRGQKPLQNVHSTFILS